MNNSKTGGGRIKKCLKITQKHSKIIVLSAGLSPRPLKSEGPVLQISPVWEPILSRF